MNKQPPMSPPSTTAKIHREVDPQIWRACAGGASARIPSLHSRVYYFPQGHVEHSCPSSFSSAPVPCVVSSVELLADPITDEVFAHLTMQPISPEHFASPSNFSSRFEEDDNNNSKVVTFAKTLTPSDANRGSGFSVPRHCADSVFPPLDFHADPPSQKLLITDTHGVVWDFRHIYRRTQRRHVLTTGWGKFVNGKKLIAGDSVVFMRKSVGEMFVGVRRAPIDGGDEYYGGGGKKEFRRTGKGKLTEEAVSEAINKAVQGYPFEVVYYTTSGWSDFVVRAEDVEVSMARYWTLGTRVKMAMEAECSSRVTWFQGIVSSTFQETGLWKQLLITWDEPEILQNLKRVNPWQVEVVAPLLPTYPPAKRFKYPHSASGFLSGEREILSSGRRQQAVDPSPYLFSFPAGMQGDRHYESGSFNSTGFIGENFFSPLSPNSSNTTNVSSGNEPVENRGHAARVNSIQLFGQIINVQEVSESGLTEFGLFEEDGGNESSDNEVVNETQLCAFTYASQGM